MIWSRKIFFLKISHFFSWKQNSFQKYLLQFFFRNSFQLWILLKNSLQQYFLRFFFSSKNLTWKGIFLPKKIFKNFFPSEFQKNILIILRISSFPHKGIFCKFLKFSRDPPLLKKIVEDQSTQISMVFPLHTIVSSSNFEILYLRGFIKMSFY